MFKRIILSSSIFLFLLGLSLEAHAQRTTMTDFLLAYNLGAYNRATNLGEELLLRKSIQEDLSKRFPLSTKLGIAYHYLGNYTRGLEHLNLAIQWAKEEGMYKPEVLLLAYHEKAKIQESIERNLEAKFNFEKTVALFEQTPKLKKNETSRLLYVNALMGVGRTSYEQKKYEVAKKSFQKALDYSKEIGLTDNALIAQKHLYLGKSEEKLNNSSKAANHMFTAIQMGKMEVTKQSSDWGVFYKDLAAYYQEYNRDDEALANNNQALKSLLPAWKGFETNKLPTIEELNQSISLGATAQVLAQRAALYDQKDEKQLQLALDNYLLLDVFVARLRRLYTGDKARLLWSDRALDFYEKAIKTCLRLYDKTKDVAYKESAFRLSERSKSVLLLEAFKKIKAKKISDVPAEKIQEEESLKEALDQAQGELDILKRKVHKESNYKEQLRKLERKLLEKKRNYEDFLTGLRKQYPSYYKLKYDLDVIDVKSIQAKLENDQLMIEYFIGREELIVFKISNESYDVFELPVMTNLTEQIEAFRKGIYGYYLEEENRNEATRETYVKKYKELGHSLYKVLLEPVLKEGQQDRLMLILAGNLGFLPFEALLTEMPKGNDFKIFPYLVNKYSIGYCYSATLLEEMQLKEHIPEKIFLGFAPEFKEGVELEGRYTFNPLKYSEEEVKEIYGMVGERGEIFTGAEATKENFEKNCEGYCILHIATHGFMNSADSKNSFLAFSEVPDSNDNELLYVRDLYNMHLTASMVVLSACETGLGKLYESEGIASLARAFAYAGSKSIITSLWSVNDHATATVMKELYKHVQAGMNKDEALRLAKLNFIKNASSKSAHPFLWSAFVLIGDESPRPGTGTNGMMKKGGNDSSFPFLPVLIGGALLLIIGGIYVRRSKHEA